MTNRCLGCGRRIAEKDIFETEYEHCRNYCCCCCPSKNGHKGEACQMEFVNRTKGKPVGILEALQR